MTVITFGLKHTASFEGIERNVHSEVMWLCKNVSLLLLPNLNLRSVTSVTFLGAGRFTWRYLKTATTFRIELFTLVELHTFSLIYRIKTIEWFQKSKVYTLPLNQRKVGNTYRHFCRTLHNIFF